MIAVLTDFGSNDGAVAAMKGVIKSINPKIDLLDISHDISAFSIREGAFVLKRCYSYFPASTIFLTIVDPGVGSNRKAILLEAHPYFFIAPDNGVLSYIYRENASARVYVLSNPKYHLSKISSTFHGRDIFAPAAANLSLGVPAYSFGEPLEKIHTFKTTAVKKTAAFELEGEIIFIDHYGNIYSNFSKTVFENELSTVHYCEVFVNEKKLPVFFKKLKFFSESNQNDEILYLGSTDLIEFAVNQGNLQARYQLKLGDKIKLDYKQVFS